MANFTKKAIKETFVELLEEHPLSDITIKDIVEKCGINRNSFYYHYHDLPDLIEEIVKEDAEGTLAGGISKFITEEMKEEIGLKPNDAAFC